MLSFLTIGPPLSSFRASCRVLLSQCAWEKLAWPSKKNLLSEFIDMLRRIAQLCSWSEDLVTPQCVWLPGLFNPTAYLTAVMQVKSLLPREKQYVGEHNHCRPKPYLKGFGSTNCMRMFSPLRGSDTRSLHSRLAN